MPPRKKPVDPQIEADALLTEYDEACENLEIARVAHDEAYRETTTAFNRLSPEQQDEVQKRYRTN